MSLAEVAWFPADLSEQGIEDLSRVSCRHDLNSCSGGSRPTFCFTPMSSLSFAAALLALATATRLLAAVEDVAADVLSPGFSKDFVVLALLPSCVTATLVGLARAAGDF